ncbi:MAG: hypothetical protein WA215_08195 [Candidatus Cybelea sp.]|jgi:hypothetical protein
MLKRCLRNPIVIALGLVVVFFLWLAFRPELLFVNKSVDEPFPTSTASAVTNLPLPGQAH